MSDYNNENREAESLFATKRRQQQEEEAEKIRQEELERKKTEMEAEIKRLEKLEEAKRLDMLDEAKRQEKKLGLPKIPKVTKEPKPEGGEGGPAPEKKGLPKPAIIAAAVIAVLVIGSFILGGKGGGSKQTESEATDDFQMIEENDAGVFNGNAYMVINEYMPFEEAFLFCEQNGAHLVTIGSEEEQKFVEKLIEQFGKRSDYWIGLVAYSDGTGCWIDDTELEYDNFMENEDSVNGYYGVMRGKTDDDTAYKWYLVSYSDPEGVSNQWGFIAEIDQIDQ